MLAEICLVEVEESLSYAKYASGQQRIVVGGSIFEWHREKDFRKSDELMGKDSRTPKVDRSRLKKPPRKSPATPGINTLGGSGYHEEDEEGKSFTLQKRLEHYRKYIDIYTPYG